MNRFSRREIQRIEDWLDQLRIGVVRDRRLYLAQANSDTLTWLADDSLASSGSPYREVRIEAEVVAYGRGRWQQYVAVDSYDGEPIAFGRIEGA